MSVKEIRLSLIREQLDSAGRAYVRVIGTGMEPLLRPQRDMVVVDRTHTIHRGDIVLLDRRDGWYSMRRVIGKGKDGYTVVGDNRWHMVKDLPGDRILGVVSRIQRDGRFISRRNLSLKFYTFLATWMAYPRIFLGQIFGKNRETQVFTGEIREQKCA